MTDNIPQEAPAAGRYDFGRNWAKFAQGVDSDNIDNAIENLDRLLPDLKGKTFLDIGCGSGLHSLAALVLGAKEVVAFDIDAESVSTTRTMLTEYAPEMNWCVTQEDVLELSPAEVGKFDIVYSWGVLHHTGDMWRAIERAGEFAKSGGELALALYLKTRFCDLWRREKALYSKHAWARPIIFGVYVTANLAARQMLKKQNPVTYVRTYKTSRGMSFWRDADDWLGGYPYDSVNSGELIRRMEKQGGELERSFNTTPRSGLFGTGCGEWVFRKT